MIAFIRRPRLFRRFAPVVAALGIVLAAQGVPASTAPPIEGAEAPGFEQALSDWLGDDESTALAALADLASGGNTAARVLLGLIDKTPALQGPYLAHLPRAARIALLRAPGGMSGRSWLAQADSPLASAWTALHQVGSGPEVIETFESLGESRAAREALVVLTSREHPALAGIDLTTLDPDVLYLLWHAVGTGGQGAIAALTPTSHPQRRQMGDTPAEHALEDWLTTSPLAEPLAALCRARCPAETAPCLSAAYQALGSLEALLTMGTPAEALIGQQSFLDTPRGQSSVMRRILLSTPMRGRRAMLARATAQSECLGTALTAENDRYRAVRPGAASGG